jgi:hypothetical protein
MSDDLSILRARFADHSGSETSQTTGSTVTSAPASIADLSAPIDDDPHFHHAVSARLSHERARASGTSHEEELESTQIIWNLLATTLNGPSLVVLPYIVGAGGVGLTPILMVLYCILSYHSLLIMGELVRRTGATSFAEMAYLGMGRFGFVWATISSILLRWGGHLLGSFIIIGDIGAGLARQYAMRGSALAESTSLRTAIIWLTAGITGAVALWPMLSAPNAPLSVMRRYWAMALLSAAMMAFVCIAMLAQCIRCVYTRLCNHYDFWAAYLTLISFVYSSNSSFYNEDAFKSPLPNFGNDFNVSLSASVVDMAVPDLLAFAHGSFTQTLGGIAFTFSYTDTAVYVLRSMRGM